MTPKFSVKKLIQPFAIGLMAIYILGLEGCLSLASFNDAKVYEKGKGEMVGHGGYFAHDSNDPFVPSSAVDLGLMSRVGLGNNFELYGRVNMQLALNAGIKYQVIEKWDGMLYGATGLSVGGMLSNIDNNNPSTWFEVPVIASFHPSPYFTWYGAVKYLSFYSASGFNMRFLHYNSGIRIGERYGALLETNFIPRWNEKSSLLGSAPPFHWGHQQVHAGIFIKF